MELSKNISAKSNNYGCQFSEEKKASTDQVVGT